MASLEGLPPLPKSLSGFNLIDYHGIHSGPTAYTLVSDKSDNDNGAGQNYAPNSENGNFTPSSIRNYSNQSSVIGECSKSGRNRATPPLRDLTQSLSFKQLSDIPLAGSARASPVITSSRTTPLSSARVSPIGTRCSTSPVSGGKGNTPPPGTRGLPPPPPPPRQTHSGIQNGFEKASVQQPLRLGRIFNLDTQLASLRKEMFSLRQMDLLLLNQLWSLNEAIQDFRNLQEENCALSPPSPPSCDESDEFYSPLSSRGYHNLSGLPMNPFAGRFNTSSSSSDTSIEFGDV